MVEHSLYEHNIYFTLKDGNEQGGIITQGTVFVVYGRRPVQVSGAMLDIRSPSFARDDAMPAGWSVLFPDSIQKSLQIRYLLSGLCP